MYHATGCCLSTDSNQRIRVTLRARLPFVHTSTTDAIVQVDFSDAMNAQRERTPQPRRLLRER
jgi:hypothetical protein